MVFEAEVPGALRLSTTTAATSIFTQPESLAMQVQVVNAVVSAARRPLDWESVTARRQKATTATSLRSSTSTSGAKLSSVLRTRLSPRRPAQGATADQVRLIDAPLAPRGLEGDLHRMRDGRVGAGDVPRLLHVHCKILALT